MRLGLFTVIGVVVAGVASAGPLALCNNTSADSNNQSSYQPFNALRGQIAITATGLAPSITLPTLATGMKQLRIDFQNRADFLFCLDAATPNNWCGTNPPTGTISNTAWVFKQASVSAEAIRNTSNTTNVMPTTMYVSGSTAGTVGYSICGMQ